MKDCIVPEIKTTPRDYVLSAITFGSWGTWKQQEYYNAKKEYYKCVEEKYANLHQRNLHTPSQQETQNAHALSSLRVSPQ